MNILVLFLLQHLNWIERYSTMKIGRFFLFEYSRFKPPTTKQAAAVRSVVTLFVAARIV